MFKRSRLAILNGCFLILIHLILSGCVAQQTQYPKPATLIFRTWTDDIPADLFADFTARSGIQVTVEGYDDQEAAAQELLTGQPADVVVMETRLIPGLIKKKAIRPVDRSKVPNFRLISPGFRGLSFDPDNTFSVPYQWGITGIVYRRDLVGRELTSWSDLWTLSKVGKVGLWRAQSRDEIGMTLRMLGYSANSEDPREVSSAIAKLRELAPNLVWLEDVNPYSCVPALVDGKVVAAIGYAYDASEGRKENPNINFVLPREGTVLWGEHFTIPTISKSGPAAEELLNYLLEPEVMAQIGNFNYFAVAHDGAIPLISEDIRKDPTIYPSEAVMANSELILAIGDTAEQQILAEWRSFLAAAGGEQP